MHIADIQLQSAATNCQKHNFCSATAAMATIADMQCSTAHTIKASMLQESVLEGVTAARSALADPARCGLDSLLAAQVAGCASSDSDATSAANLSVCHTIASVASGYWQQQGDLTASPLSYSELIAAALPLVLRTVASCGTDEERAALEVLAAAILPTSNPGGTSIVALAEWIERRGAEMGVHGLVGTIASGKPEVGNGGQAQVSAELLALEIWNSPTLSLRPNPIWLNGADSILELLQCSPHNHFATLDEQCKQQS